jgi:transposase-like protein
MRVMAAPRKYPDELRERAVRLVLDARQDGSVKGACGRVGAQLGIPAETLRNWVRVVEVDTGLRPGTLSAGAARDRRARAGELRAAAGERDLEERVGFLRGGARPPTQQVVRYIDAHRAEFGVAR